MNQDLHVYAGRVYVQVKIEIARLIRPVSPQMLLIRQIGLDWEAGLAGIENLDKSVCDQYCTRA
jgi:hypothetical protein